MKPLLFTLLITIFTFFSATAKEVVYQIMSDYDRQIIATCLILEASSEGPKGMQAVLNVVSNRAKGRPDQMVAEVIRKGQFTAMKSIWSKPKPNYSPLVKKAKNDRNFNVALDLVAKLEKGDLADLTFGSTHYYQLSIAPPSWTFAMAYTTQIGTHRFYRP